MDTHWIHGTTRVLAQDIDEMDNFQEEFLSMRNKYGILGQGE